MELWIRSQNKADLIKVEMLGQTDGVISAYFVNGNCKLGTYKSSKRALEVLDEIDECMSNAVNNGLNVVRYKMPEE